MAWTPVIVDLSYTGTWYLVFLLNRNGYFMAFRTPAPSHFTSLKSVFLFNRHGYYIAVSTPMPSRFILLNRRFYQIELSQFSKRGVSGLVDFS